MLIAYLEEYYLAVARKNGPNLAELLQLPPLPVIEKQIQRTKVHEWKQLVAECHQVGLNASLSFEVLRQKLISHYNGHKEVSDLNNDDEEEEEAVLWNGLVSLHLKVLMTIYEKRLEAALMEQLALIQIFHRIFQGNSRWILPISYVLHEDLWHIASVLKGRRSITLAINNLSLDTQTESEQEGKLEECARIINKAATICLTDRSSLGESRKWGVYRSVALLLQVYFYLGQLNLCTNVLRALSAADLPDATRYPVGHLVTFRYWLGKYYFVHEQWERAEAELSLAFAHCMRTSMHNKRLILHLLIPLRLHLRGILPGVDLLRSYGLLGQGGFYAQALLAIKKGDLATYSGLLHRHERGLLQRGTFLLWELLITFVYRNLFRRVHQLLGGGSRVPLGALLVGTSCSGDDHTRSKMDVDEIAYHVANLIARGLIRGYIHQEKATLVLSLKDPFPKLSVAP